MFRLAVLYDLERRGQRCVAFAVPQVILDDAPFADVRAGADLVHVAAGEDLAPLVHGEQQVAGFVVAQGHHLPDAVQIDESREDAPKGTACLHGSRDREHRPSGTIVDEEGIRQNRL